MSDAPESLTLHVLVLAAGASRRFGSPKQLVRINGRPMLHTVVSRAVEVAGHAVTVVLGAGAKDLAGLLRHTPASIVVNRHWEEGIGSSIREGIARLPGSAAAVLITLADQPSVSAEDLKRLASAWRARPEQIIASHYAGITGVPAIFPAWVFAELLELRGDHGAHGLLQRHADRVLRIATPAAALDIDTPEDLLEVTPEATAGSPRPREPP
jgi:molybdenum cofactor cytidylyltransferase